MKKQQHLLYFLLSFILLFNFCFAAQVLASEVSQENSAAPVVRLYGKDRIATSVAVSREGWETADTVILNELSNYADAICATPLAVQLNAPILLTTGDKLDPQVISELKRLKAKQVILLGGNGRLQPAIENELAALHYTWERIGGANRFETSALIAQRVGSDSMLIVNGDNFPDALSAASYAGIEQIPILLITKLEFPQSLIDYYQRNQPNQVVVIGGDGVVPDQLLADNGIDYDTRLGGRDRYETDAQLYAYAEESYTSDQVYLASGEQYPDAMVGTVLAAKNKAPLLITTRSTLPGSIAPIFNPGQLIAKNIFILGGTAVVSGKIQAELEGKDFSRLLLTGKTIVVDPGHGTPDPGAIGPTGTQEKNNNLAIARFLADELKKAGANVILTRNDDNSPAYGTETPYTERADLQKRVDIANANNADLFISIHNDSWQTAYGTTTYYSLENRSGSLNALLAQNVQSQLTKSIGRKDLGVKNSRLYVLRNNTMPAVLVEVAFISHPNEEKLLADDVFRQKAAQGISNGIQQYVRTVEGL